MSSRPPRTPVKDFSIPKGATRDLQFTVTKGGAAVNLTAAGLEVVLVARGKTADPIIRKGYRSAGTSSPYWPVESALGGITGVNLAAGIVKVTFVPADTAQETLSLLAYEVWCSDGSSVTPILKGTITVEDAVPVA